MDLWLQLPASLRDHTPRAPRWSIAATALGVAACSFGGAYLTIDEGKLHFLIAAAAGPFAALVARTSLRGKGPGETFARAVGLALLFGIAVALIGLLGLSALDRGYPDPGVLLFGSLFAGIYGSVFGFAYGLPIAVFLALVKRATQDGSQAGDEVGVGLSGLFLIASGLAAAAVAHGFLKEEMAPSGIVAALVVAAGGVLLTASAVVRGVRRRRWIARVREGKVPGFRVRVPLRADEGTELPLLASGGALLEWHPDPLETSYRRAAQGTLLARV